MNFKYKPFGVIGLIIFSASYIILSFVTKDTDFIVRELGLFGAPVWVVQWFAFLVGGQIFSFFITVSFVGLIGFLLGCFTDSIIKKIKKTFYEF